MNTEICKFTGTVAFAKSILSLLADTTCSTFTARQGVSEHRRHLYNPTIGDMFQAYNSLYTCAGIKCHYVGLKAQPVTFLSSSHAAVVHQQTIIWGFASGAGKTLCRATIKTSSATNTRPENFPFTLFILPLSHLIPFLFLVERESSALAFLFFQLPQLFLCEGFCSEVNSLA